jgi:hypothetical protein
MESKSTQTDNNKSRKEVSLYSKIINELPKMDYVKKRTEAYSSNDTIRLLSKITYLKKSYIFEKSLLELPEATEDEVKHKYNALKCYVDDIKIKRLKNTDDVTLKRNKSIYIKKSQK